MPPNSPSSKQNIAIESILDSESHLLEDAAGECWPAVRNHILANGGHPEDAEDLIHDAVLVVYNRAKNGTLELSGSLGAYLFGICKNEWMHRLRDKRRKKQITNQLPVEYKTENFEDTEWLLAERQRLYIEKLDAMDERCRQLLELSFQKIALKEIAAMLNYTYDYARQKKVDCTAALTKMIRQDNRFKDLI